MMCTKIYKLCSVTWHDLNGQGIKLCYDRWACVIGWTAVCGDGRFMNHYVNKV